MEGPTQQMLRSSGRCFRHPLPRHLPPQTPGKGGPCRETPDPTRPPPISSHCNRAPPFRLGWCQISYHARPMLPDSPSSEASWCAITLEARLCAQASIKKGGFGDPMLHFPAAFLATSSSTAALCNSLWTHPMWTPPRHISATPSDDDAAWRPDAAMRTQSYLSHLCDAYILDTLMATQRDWISFELRRAQGRSLVGGPN